MEMYGKWKCTVNGNLPDAYSILLFFYYLQFGMHFSVFASNLQSPPHNKQFSHISAELP